MSLDVIVAFALVSAGLVATSVEIFFRTSAFQQEYSEIANSLFIASKSDLLSAIEDLINQRKTAKVSKQPVTMTFPEATIDLEEGILSEIREIGAQADNWLMSMQRGKSLLRTVALLTFALSIILFIFVGLILLLPLSSSFLFLEYFAGPILIFLGIYAARYALLVRNLDKAYIELKKTQKA